MDVKYMYTFRGLMGFVAFTDIGIAIKAFIEKKSIFNELSNSEALTRIYGIFAILQALILIHCTVFIHYKPLVSLAICSSTLSIMMYTFEALFFHTTLLDFIVIYPCILNVMTTLGLIVTLFLGSNRTQDDENNELLQKLQFRKYNEKLK